MHYKMNDSSRNVNGSEPHFLWKHEKLPPTDSRRRTDHRCLENGAYAKAKEEKLRLNQRQLRIAGMEDARERLEARRLVKEKGSQT
ncbi:hypothetical protein NC652_011437 [Populus alba x Populus x berolinensis]|nr:hypothetical protein NC652_011437 [Populus alba x Populus x berolinensis]